MAEAKEQPQPHTEYVAHIETDRTKTGTDDALQYLNEHERVTWEPDEEKAVKKKIDMVVLPLLFFAALFSYMDTSIFGFAGVLGLVKDLKLYDIQIVGGEPVQDTTKYSLATGITYIGQIVGQYPLLFLSQRFPMGRYLAVIEAYAGLLTLLFVTPTGYAGVMVLRFFYGFQSVIQPLCIIITSMWWKTDEQPLAVGIWITGAALGNLVGHGTGFGAITLEGQFADMPWKWIYVIFGAFTLVNSVVMFFLLPASPMTAWFLSERQRIIAVQRLVKNQTGIKSRRIKWKHVLEMFKDPQALIFVVFSFSFSFANSSFGSFGGFLATSFGYSSKRALVLLLPAGAVACVSILTSGFLGAFFPNHRLLLAIIYLLPTIAGNVLLWQAPRDNRSALLAGLCICVSFYGSLVQFSSLMASNIGGSTKKSVVNATYVVLGSLGGFSGPYSYKGEEAARGYPTGQISALSMMSLCTVLCVVLWFWYGYCNKKRASSVAGVNGDENDVRLAFSDLTDRENPAFVYVR